MQTLWQDLKYAARTLRKSPGFTLVAVLTLALGIGANSAIFSVVHSALLQPLPYENPDRLYIIWESASQVGFPKNTPAPANFFDWQARSQSFSKMSALYTDGMNLTGDGQPEFLAGAQVSANFFEVFGVQPQRGRGFVRGEDAAGAGQVVVISNRLWQRRFGGDEGALGKVVHISGKPYTVVGVAPATFRFPSPEFDLWMPMPWDADDKTNRGNHFLYVVGRLKDGVTEQAAAAEIQTIAKQLEQEYPATNKNLGAHIESLRAYFAGDVRRPLWVLMGAVGLLLLIACVNIANLMLARATARRREMAIRAALGAGGARLVRLMLSESVLLAVCGGALGVALASAGLGALGALLPESIAFAGQITLNSTVLAFTLGISVVTGILFGLIPALQVRRVDLSSSLKAASQSIASGHRGLRSVLIAGEVALSLCLLVGAGLMMRTLMGLLNAPLGFQPENVLTLRTAIPPARYKDQNSRIRFFKQVTEKVRALPGVEAAGYTGHLPLVFQGDSVGVRIEGRPEDPAGIPSIASIRVITPEYFRAMGMGIRAGRGFTEMDTEKVEPVMVVNEQFARKYFPGEEVIGKRVWRAGRWVTISGIVQDVRQWGVDIPPKEEMYVPMAQHQRDYFLPQDLAIRTAGNPLAIADAVRQVVREVDPDQPVFRLRTLEDVVSFALAQRKLQSYLFGGFAGLALLLAAVGVYGVLAHLVSERTHEFGIRMALGAQRGDVLRLVLRHGLLMAGIGVVIGAGAALVLTRFMSGMLYGVKANDPATFASVAALLLVIAAAATYLPARHATKVDPMVALRYE